MHHSQCHHLHYKDLTLHLLIQAQLKSLFLHLESILKYIWNRAFLEYLKCYKYIARDDGGELYIYMSIPTKRSDCWGADGAYRSLRGLDIDFPMVKWSDEEPWLIKDLKKLEVVDEYEK